MTNSNNNEATIQKGNDGLGSVGAYVSGGVGKVPVEVPVPKAPEPQKEVDAGGMKTTAKEVGEGLKSLGDKAAKATDAGEGLVEDLGSGVASAAHKLGDYVKGEEEEEDTVKTKIDDAGEGMKDAVSYVGDKVENVAGTEETVDAASADAGGMKTTAKEVGDALKSLGDKTASATENVGDGLIKDVGSGVAGAANKLGDYVKPEPDQNPVEADAKKKIDAAKDNAKQFVDYVEGSAD